MKKLLPIEGKENLVRDTVSGAILNVDTNALMEHRKKKLLAQEKKIKERNQENEINKLKADVSELRETTDKILSLVEKLVNGRD